jgi:short subunit dehydrogenase-like uncharacterized protein
MSKRDVDLVLFGATGFTGRLAAAYLAEQPHGLRWAIAGRNRGKLEAMASELPGEVGIVVADSGDAASIAAMAASTAVLATTAGPYAKYGTPVVDACVEHQTHYVDITGESLWVRELIDKHHERAAKDGTRIVPMCGFDSVPSDLGVFLMSRAVREAFGEETASVRAVFRMSGGGLNGGTLASILELSQRGDRWKSLDPVLLNPAAHQTEALRKNNRDGRGVVWDADLKTWLFPFVMAMVNTRVVRRSQALLTDAGEGYGANFRYDEWMGSRRRSVALMATATLGLGGAAVMTAPGRFVARKFGPKPGAGPSEEAQHNARTSIRYVAVSESGQRVHGKMAYDGDAGNRLTIRLLCESALALALQLDDLPQRGGILTPATALGSVLLDRIRPAGITWETSLS